MRVPLDRIPDVRLYELIRHDDHRGYVCEIFSGRHAEALGPGYFRQDNIILSPRAGTVRGLHFQRAPAAQAKFVTVLQGALFDVAVDLRERSPTFGKWVGAELSYENRKQMLIPEGFAHGFCTLEPDTLVLYKLSHPYSPTHEAGIAWNDPTLAVDWPVAPANAVLSKKDAKLPSFEQLVAASPGPGHPRYDPERQNP